MNEGQTETAEQPTTTPAPVAEQVATPETQAQPAVTENKTQTQPEPVKADPKAVAREAFQRREEKREKKNADRVAELEREIAALKASKTQPEAKPEPTFIDDPDAWIGNEREKLKAEARAEVEAIIAEKEEAYNYQLRAENAGNFILTRSHTKADRAFLDEVLKVTKEKYGHIGHVDPMAASRLAYEDVCRTKGVMPDVEGFKSPANSLNASNGASSMGTRPSAPASGSGGKRMFKPGEGERYINEVAPGTPERRQRIAEVEEAMREGRIKR
jgi:hypothetical protein